MKVHGVLWLAPVLLLTGVLLACKDEADFSEFPGLSNNENPVTSPALGKILVEPSGVALRRGVSQSFKATINGGSVKTVTWSLSGNELEGTTIEASGLNAILKVDADETAQALTVTAALSGHPDKSVTALVILTDNLPNIQTPDEGGLNVRPDRAMLGAGDEQIFGAYIPGHDDVAVNNVEWSVDGEESSVFEGNKLTIGGGEAAETLTVTATLQGVLGDDSDDLYGTATVAVLGNETNPIPANFGIELSPQIVPVVKGASIDFKAYDRTGDDNIRITSGLTWQVFRSVSGTTVNTSGQLTVSENESAEHLIVRAKDTQGNYGTAVVWLIPKESAISILPATVKLGPGDKQIFNAYFPGYGTGNAVEASGVTWSVDSENGSDFAGNELTVARGETAETLTVKASMDEGWYGTATVTVLGNESNLWGLDNEDTIEPEINNGVRIQPGVSAVVKGATVNFKAYDSTDNSEIDGTDLTWQVFYGGDETTLPNGSLTVAADESATHLIVRAKTGDGDYGTAVVWVIGNGYPQEGTSIIVSPPATMLGPGDTQTYNIFFSDGLAPIGVTWSVDGEDGSGFEGNVLTVAADEAAETLTVKANLGQDLAGKEIFGAATVTVLGNESDPESASNEVWLSLDTIAVVKGETVDFAAYSNSDRTEDSKIPDEELNWQVFNGGSGTTISGGSLTVAADESATYLIVRAKTEDGSYGTAVIWIVGNGYPETGNSLVVNPPASIILRGEKQTFSVYFSADGLVAYGATWTVNSTKGSAFNGSELTVATGETKSPLTVTATLGSGVSGTASVIVLSDSTLQVNGIKVSPQTGYVIKGGTRNFVAYNTADSLIMSGVAWSVFRANATGTTINPASGQLTVAADESAENLIVLAKTANGAYGTAIATVRATEPDGSVMVEIPGGSFTRSDGKITLSAFSISKYEVTQKQWKDVMGTTVQQQDAGSVYSGTSGWGDGLVGTGDNYPMYHVNWYDAVRFCNELSLLKGLDPVYTIVGTTVTRTVKPTVTANFSKNGYRLPTEAEWEYAARGGQTYTYAGSNTLSDVAWHGTNSGDKTHPIGEKAPNGYGLYDMNGNVWEWCWDWYGSYTSGSKTNPTGPSSGTYKVNRGADWFRGSPRDSVVQDSYKLNFRQDDYPEGRWRSIGFRVVRRP